MRPDPVGMAAGPGAARGVRASEGVPVEFCERGSGARPFPVVCSGVRTAWACGKRKLGRRTCVPDPLTLTLTLTVIRMASPTLPGREPSTRPRVDDLEQEVVQLRAENEQLQQAVTSHAIVDQADLGCRSVTSGYLRLMRLLTELRDADRSLTKQAAFAPRRVGKVLSAVEESAESTKLWCGAAAGMAWLGGWRGRKAAAGGLAALAMAQIVSNVLCKQLADRPRPPKEWFPHDEVDDRPDSSSFPSGHTAAAVAFTAAVTHAWPAVGVACAAPAAVIALERVQSGAHYPSDVAAGAAIGLAGAWLTHHALHLTARRWLST